MAAPEEQHTFELQMVPSRNAVRGDDGAWTELPAAAKRALTEVVGDDLKPIPGVGLIGAAPAPDPAPVAAAEPGGLSWLEGLLVVGALIVVAAGFVALGRRRPSLRRRGTAPQS
jgi:hypothetical protein